MTVVYLDAFLVLNFVVNYLLLACAGKLDGEPVGRGRTALAAALGAAYGGLALLPDWGFLEHPVCKAGAAVLMLLAAFGRSERLLRTGALFLVLSCAFGGALLLVAMVRGGDPGTGGLLGPSLGMRGILIAAALSYGMLSLLLRGQFAHTRTGGELQELTLSRQGRSVTVLALREPSLGPVFGLKGGATGGGWAQKYVTGTARAGPAEPVPPGGPAAGPGGGTGRSAPAASALPGGGGGVRYAAGPAGGPGPLWPLGVPELFDRPLSHPAVRWGRILRPHRRTGGSLSGRIGNEWEEAHMKGRFGVWYLRLCQWLARHRLWRPGKIMYIGGSDVLPAPLSREEEGELIARLAEGDQAASSTLIEHNLRLVVYIARRFENTGINIEDLISIGTIGLIKAVGTYQPAKNIKLATYASRCIENEILMHLRKTASLKSEVPFDEPLSTDWNGNELLLSDILGTESDLVMRPMEEDADRQLLADALEKLTQREREIITLRFGLGGRREHTQKEVADRMGISQSYISRLEKRIIGRLKREILKVTEIP